MPIDTLLMLLVLLVGILVGYGIGVLSSGIKIYHLEKLPKDQDKEEYNESMADYMPPEQRQYYEQNSGRNSW
jgi:hypothetical protein